MNIEHQRAIREYEIQRVMPLIPSGSRVLEVGAGAGWQARVLAEAGFAVHAIELNGSHYLDFAVWPVQPYDGVRIPFHGELFDVVFTSNVLDHVQDVEGIDREIRRVLKPAGMVIHVVPTPTWRFWTIVAHHPYHMKNLALLPFRQPGLITVRAPRARTQSTGRLRAIAQAIHGFLIPERLGERGNAFSELYRFSRRYRTRWFTQAGWHVIAVEKIGLYYSGRKILDFAIGLETRRRMARLLGSSGDMYVLKKQSAVNGNAASKHTEHEQRAM